MDTHTLTAISPLDGRYSEETKILQEYFSEYALIKYRILVQIEWLIALGSEMAILWSNGFTVNNHPNLGSVSPGVAGYAFFNPSLSVSRAIVLTTQSNTTSCVGTTCVPWTIIGSKTFFAIVVHELGHMLGLWSHSYDDDDIMHPFVDETVTLSNRDRRTLAHAYTFTPQFNLSLQTPNAATLGSSLSSSSLVSQVSHGSNNLCLIQVLPNTQIRGFFKKEL